MSFLRSASLAVSIVCGLVVSGCNTVQTTSGKQYLSNFPTKPDQSQLMEVAGPRGERVYKDGQWVELQRPNVNPPTFEDKLRQVASVEPLLRFPARIGLARVETSHLTAIPNDEAAIWQKMGEKLGTDYGSLVPISPMIVEMVSSAPVEDTGYQSGYGYNWTPSGSGPLGQVVSAIRLGAARQHVDAVLIYEVAVRTDEDDNLLSWANFTIIGAAILPGYEIQSDAVANALLIDVRNAYPYGHTTATAEDSSMAPAMMTRRVRRNVDETARLNAVSNLAKDVEGLTRQLKAELNKLPPVIASK